MHVMGGGSIFRSVVGVGGNPVTSTTDKAIDFRISEG